MQYIPAKAELDRMIQDVAGECVSRMVRWQQFCDKMDSLTNDDLTALGYEAGAIAYIRSMVVALKQIVLFYDDQQNSAEYADNPKYFVGEMTRMLII